LERPFGRGGNFTNPSKEGRGKVSPNLLIPIWGQKRGSFGPLLKFKKGPWGGRGKGKNLFGIGGP